MSLEGTYDPGNIFAKIIRGEVPAAKVLRTTTPWCSWTVPAAEDTWVIATEPGAPPRLRAGVLERLIWCPAGDAGDGGAEASIGHPFSARPGDYIFHLHFHIIPRWRRALGRRGRRHGRWAEPQAGAKMPRR